MTWVAACISLTVVGPGEGQCAGAGADQGLFLRDNNLIWSAPLAMRGADNLRALD
jgi:hypothetical protein